MPTDELTQRIQNDFEHDLRKMVDNYRQTANPDDKDLAVVLDAVRAELELGNYQEAF